MSYYISGRNGFCGIPSFLPSFPLANYMSSASSHFIFLLWSSATLCSSHFSLFITSKPLNAPPLCLSPFPPFSSIKLFFFILFCNTITQSLSSSLPLSSLSFHHRHVLYLLHTFTNTFFPSSPAILWHSYPPIPYLSVPPFTPTYHLFFCCFLHLILSPLSPCLLALFSHQSVLFPPVLLVLYTHHKFWKGFSSSLLKQFSS